MTPTEEKPLSEKRKEIRKDLELLNLSWIANEIERQDASAVERLKEEFCECEKHKEGYKLLGRKCWYCVKADKIFGEFNSPQEKNSNKSSSIFIKPEDTSKKGCGRVVYLARVHGLSDNENRYCREEELCSQCARWGNE